MSTHPDANTIDDLPAEQPTAPPDAATTDPGADDDDWLTTPGPRRRMPRVSAALVAATLLALAFTGGVLVQKHHDQTLTAASAAPGGVGGFAGRGGFGGGAGAGGGATGSASAATASAPAVVGQVVSLNGNVLVVRNLGGKDIRVTLPARVSITEQSTIAASKLSKGTNVVITGTTNANGAVTATGVTAR
jgi:hypothetical protein